jgi:hypothetical protein
MSVLWFEIKRHRKQYLFLKGLCILAVLNQLFICIDLARGALFNAILSLVSIFFVFFISLYFVIRGKKTTIYFFVAWSVFLISACCYYFLQLGIISYSFHHLHILQYGSTFEITVLSLLLANKYRTLKKEKESLQRRSKEAREKQRLIGVEQELYQLKQREEVFMDIHDAIGSVLVDLKMRVANFKPGEAIREQTIEKLSKLIEQAREGLKDRIYLLEDWKVFEEDPFSGIKLLMLRRYHLGSRPFEFRVDPQVEKLIDNYFDISKRKILFHLILEIVNNDLKYGKEKSIWEFHQSFENIGILSLTVNTTYEKNMIPGKGTLNIYQRSEQLNGKLHIWQESQVYKLQIHFSNFC